MTAETPFPPARGTRPLQIVLVGTSLEEGSDPIVRAGLAVARAAGAQIHLAHATPGGPRLAGPEIGLGDDFAQGISAWCEERLRSQIERVGVARSELAGVEVVEGAPIGS